MVLFCQKMVEQYQKVKNLYSHKKLAYISLRSIYPFHIPFSFPPNFHPERHGGGLPPTPKN